MDVLRVFNNNVVLARDDAGREVVLTGRGLGYQGRPGDRVDASKVAQTFVPDIHHDVEQLSAFLTAIPPEHLALAAEILEGARSELGIRFSQAMIIPLADHISYAIKRVRQQVAVQYPLRAEVAHLYPIELRVARAAVQLVRERTGVDLPADEAVPIALHFVNAVFATADLSRTFQMTEVFEQVFGVLESAYGRRFDTESVNAARFLTHLRYFFVRVDADAQLLENPISFTSTIRTSFPEAYQSAERLQALLELRLGKPITPDEVVYLTLHIARLASET
ncbi:MAG TPA: PRD domain-containing protein [Propionicimonas sp.]|jgi:beta-glucoside operon transcriptional antiterminator|uniref:PRD domain-containing protein n=1 Tax=Propionicimonas sp. TaxID=1955623 RepID=UPI002F3E3F80